MKKKFEDGGVYEWYTQHLEEWGAFMSTPESESLQVYESEEGQSSDESDGGDVDDGTTEVGGVAGESETNND